MSVTFCATPGKPTQWIITCGHENGAARSFENFSHAESFLLQELIIHGETGHLAVCGDEFCKNQRMLISPVYENEGPTLNVSNVNARALLAVLGLDTEELMGGEAPDSFLGRILVAQGLNPADAGIPAVEDISETGMTMIDCGRPEGYTDDKLAQLRDIVQFAQKNGRDISWS